MAVSWNDYESMGGFGASRGQDILWNLVLINKVAVCMRYKLMGSQECHNYVKVNGSCCVANIVTILSLKKKKIPGALVQILVSALITLTYHER